MSKSFKRSRGIPAAAFFAGYSSPPAVRAEIPCSCQEFAACEIHRVDEAEVAERERLAGERPVTCDDCGETVPIKHTTPLPAVETGYGTISPARLVCGECRDRMEDDGDD